MTDSKPWLSRLREVLERQASDDDPVEQLSLSVMDLFDTVPDYEVCEAYHTASGELGDPLTDALAAECERRNLDF